MCKHVTLLCKDALGLQSSPLCLGHADPSFQSILETPVPTGCVLFVLKLNGSFLPPFQTGDGLYLKLTSHQKSIATQIKFITGEWLLKLMTLYQNSLVKGLL